MEIKLEINRIGDKKPNNGASCWVVPRESYPQVLTYDKTYHCWDDSEGDDFERDLDDDDIYIELPENLRELWEKRN